MTTHTPQPAMAATDKTVSHILGEICWLMSQSPVHKQMFLGDLEWFAMPAILLEQFRTFNGPQHPVGVAFWAMVSEETENRLLEGANKIRPDEWKNGDRPWLIELLAPFGGQDEMLQDLGKHIFPNKSFKFHFVNPEGKRDVKEFTDHIVN
jgi:cytolysin-activating lysine-acyltransferase